jgi:peptidoglycan/xylan/chitin deacetylase (PgdA/CDA1 family)
MLKFLFGDNGIIPVVMFHSIGLCKKIDWVFNYISEPIDYFKDKIEYLHKKKFNFITWNDLYDYMAGLRKIRLPAVLITFDDGYVDNFLYAYPILKRYGAKCTIFVNPDFVHPQPIVRSLKNHANTQEKQEIPSVSIGFLSWEEMRKMEESGLVDIQSHSLTHTWYCSGPKPVDFHAPGNNLYPWMAWNRFPGKKPYYMSQSQDCLIKYGTPILEHSKSLVCRQFFPNKNIEKNLVSFVDDSGGEVFFQKSNWKQKLYDKFEQFSTNNHNGTYETREEQMVRIRHELVESKQIIQRELGKRVDYICWPGGGYNQKIASLAKEVGYKSWTLGSRDQSTFRNRFQSNPEVIKRIGSYTKIKIKGVDYGYASGMDLFCSIKRHQHAVFFKYLDYFNKSKLLVKRYS